MRSADCGFDDFDDRGNRRLVPRDGTRESLQVLAACEPVSLSLPVPLSWRLVARDDSMLSVASCA